MQSTRSFIVSILRRAGSAAAPAAVLVLALANESFAVPITVPTGLNAGDEYRLAFVTSGTRDGSSTNIADYDAFVAAQAVLSSELASLATGWQAIGSTSSTAARDHTGTNPGLDGAGVPIYLLNDSILADDNTDLWNGTIDTVFRIDQFGNVRGAAAIYTGTNTDGTASATRPLGAGQNLLGENFQTGGAWVAAGVNTNNAASRPLYAISGVLTVPEPSTGALLAFGIVALARMGRRRDA